MMKKETIQLENESMAWQDIVVEDKTFSVVEVQIKIMVIYHHKLFRIAKIKGSDNSKC